MKNVAMYIQAEYTNRIGKNARKMNELQFTDRIKEKRSSKVLCWIYSVRNTDKCSSRFVIKEQIVNIGVVVCVFFLV